jgi:mannosyltransferase OCH1-like enzyme
MIESARKMGATEIAVLNDDIELGKGSLPALARALRSDDELAVISPFCGKPVQVSSPGRLVYTEGLWDDEEGGRRMPHPGMTPFCFMFKAELPLPKFDESFKWWIGDNLFEQQVRDAGYRLACASGIFVKHHTSSSGKKRWSELTPIVQQDNQHWMSEYRHKEADLWAAESKNSIPRILHRVALGEEPRESARFWSHFYTLHPGWLMMSHGSYGLDPKEWPLTAEHWSACQRPAQQADLMRLEALWRWGGIYVDWDCEAYRSLEPLLPLKAFAAYETPGLVLNGVMGARPRHPAIKAAIDLALERMKDPDYAKSLIMYATGPGVVTTVFRGRDDVLLLPPETFYPYGCAQNQEARAAARRDYSQEKPWAFMAHHWDDSWEDRPAGPSPVLPPAGTYARHKAEREARRRVRYA